jgi:O-antigen/teichoic acid export membrane protein
MSQAPHIRLFNITLLNFLSKIVFYLFVFAVGIISSRKLTSHAFGEVQFLSFLVGLSWMGLNFGLPGMLAKFWPSAVLKHNGKLILQLLKRAFLTACISIIAHIIFVIIIYQIVIIHIPFVHLMLWTFSNIALSVTTVFMQATYRYKQSFYLNLVACLLGLGFLLIAFSHLQQLAYLYCFIIVNLFLSIGYCLLLSKFLYTIKDETESGHEEIPPANNWLKTSAYFAISAILAGILWQRFELSLLKHYYNFDQLAVYAIAFTLVSLFAEPLKLIPSGLLYFFSGIKYQQEEASAKFSDFFIHFVWLVSFCGSFVYTHMDDMVVLFYTDKYAAAAEYARYLLIGFIPGICGYVFMNMHTGLGKARFLFIQDSLCALLFITGLGFAIPWFGLIGAALTKSAVMIISVIIGAWYTHHHLRYDLPIIKPLLSFLIAFVLVYLSREMFAENLILLLIKAAILFGLYLMISLPLGLIRKDLINETMGRIRNFAL